MIFSSPPYRLLIPNRLNTPLESFAQYTSAQIRLLNISDGKSKMAIYVDNVKIKWQGREWCHLVADSLEELHGFARTLGLKRSWFQAAASYPHYDVTIEVRQKALRLGAHEGCRRKIISCAKAMKAEQTALLHQPAPQQFSLFFDNRIYDQS